MEAVVVDAGSKFLKAGFAIPDKPPPIIIPTQMKPEPIDNKGDKLVESDCVTIDPVVRGYITNWDAMEDLIHYVLYTNLHWESGGNILFTEPLLTPKAMRERFAQLMFEKFNAFGFYAVEQPLLSLYATGRISGCLLDIGHGKIDTAIVSRGEILHKSSHRSAMGSSDLTDLLARELGKSNPLVNISLKDVEKIKEQYATCAEDEIAYDKLQKSCPNEQHTLPDGQVITIGRERYKVGEALFRPCLLGLETHGIAEELVRCVLTLPEDNMQRNLPQCTVLCGGAASMDSLESRFKKEAILTPSSLQPYRRSVDVLRRPEGMPKKMSAHQAWSGGAILAKFIFPQDKYITKNDYDEHGPAVVHRKCFSPVSG